MLIKSQKDFYAGLLFMAIGAAFAWGATNYRVGTSASMGPGFFPLMLGLLLVLLGLVITLRAMARSSAGSDKIGAWAFKPLFFVIAANLLFGVLLGGLPGLGIPAMGLVLGIYGLTLVASLAGEKFKLQEALVLASVLALGSYLAFVVLLKLQFAVWPTFMNA
ncbi:tripartite tricarboxylate transporter TctB family protein [Rhodoferax sp.]|uniref:tripartite tricarboxylate transporter TctB family protein n=1 Tax=Rhodoferax sp. TaxID=50421 RepID=UPI0026267925|nr:tripartite tricarboxylate transporter TctB family protein [Rhodoferax sp.]MDD2809438.1 tripartite tricarboxylate transporter TctB family protein [Rhodoferax sp.]MDD4942342.1 tripartite tricarboxylate transporter TctB family protein [Rhodoferax sp.]MDD5479131.1 tripartite tricarboxylate transporter TctB family protein [Rhodoferax sp.]